MARKRRGERKILTIARKGRFFVAEPLFERGPQLPLVRSGFKPRDGEMVWAEVDSRGARPLEHAGRPDRARHVVDALMRERGANPSFPAALESEAERAAAGPADPPSPRTDLTALPTFTVDPATARDFDDAVSAERRGDGVRVWVHIADVAAHVRPGTALDAEALRRANSTYAPGAVAPMLPRVLSDRACSLEPGERRLAVTTELDLSADAEVLRASFYRSVIRSDARLDYDELDRIFAGRERAPEPVETEIALAREVAAALAARRPSGALDVNTAEPEFSFDGDHVAAAHSVPDTEAHRLIEMLMIRVNEVVAEAVERRGLPALYRVHEQPDPERVLYLTERLAALDVPTPATPDELSFSEAEELLGELSRRASAYAAATGHGSAAYTSLVLRSLKQAYYSARNLGHAGLSSPAYAHFTSPIRRYPDLVVHRALLDSVGAGERAMAPDAVADAGVHCSEREREAAKIERAADDVCAAFLLQRELLERGHQVEFEGEVNGVIGGGAFVSFAGELADVYEGFLPVRMIRGDHYDLDEHEVSLVGRRSGDRVRMGDPVKVRVRGVEPARGRVDLEPGEPSGKTSR